MKLLIIRGHHGKNATVNVTRWATMALSVCVLGVPLGVGWWLGALKPQTVPEFFQQVADSLASDIDAQRQVVDQVRTDSQTQVRALSMRVAELQSRLVRMEALGERVISRAELDQGEFDFSSTPALGGPALLSGEQAQVDTTLEQTLAQLEWQINDRQMQLELLSALLIDQGIELAASPSGLPAEAGWISSRFGYRTDPFTGNRAWHGGVDIAGREGSNVLAVAAGVVTGAEERSGYGNFIEITHDDEIVTRYAHHSEILVSLGDIVRKGQVIGKMGTTGRSTGPHVHFEVYKNGRPVDPASYIQRTIR